MDFRTSSACERFVLSPSGDVFFKYKNGRVAPAACAVDVDGYRFVKCQGPNGRTLNLKVHRLIATEYADREPGANVVDHVDFDRANNSQSNLSWVTAAKNSARRSRYTVNPFSRILSDEDVANIRKMHSDGISQREIVRATGISRPHIGKIVRGQRRPIDESTWTLK